MRNVQFSVLMTLRTPNGSIEQDVTLDIPDLGETSEQSVRDKMVALSRIGFASIRQQVSVVERTE